MFLTVSQFEVTQIKLSSQRRNFIKAWIIGLISGLSSACLVCYLFDPDYMKRLIHRTVQLPPSLIHSSRLLSSICSCHNFIAPPHHHPCPFHIQLFYDILSLCTCLFQSIPSFLHHSVRLCVCVCLFFLFARDDWKESESSRGVLELPSALNPQRVQKAEREKATKKKESEDEQKEEAYYVLLKDEESRE